MSIEFSGAGCSARGTYGGNGLAPTTMGSGAGSGNRQGDGNGCGNGLSYGVFGGNDNGHGCGSRSGGGSLPPVGDSYHRALSGVVNDAFAGKLIAMRVRVL